MNTFRLLLASLLIAALPAAQSVHAQCTADLNLNANLAASASAEADVYMSIELQTVTVDLDWSGNGFGPYASDVLMYVYAPDGSCAVWGGWNVDANAACTDLGTDL